MASILNHRASPLLAEEPKALNVPAALLTASPTTAPELPATVLPAQSLFIVSATSGKTPSSKAVDGPLFIVPHPATTEQEAISSSGVSTKAVDPLPLALPDENVPAPHQTPERSQKQDGPPVAPAAGLPQSMVATGLPMDPPDAGEPIAGHLPLGRVLPADPLAAVQPVKVAVEQARSEPNPPKQFATVPPTEVLLSSPSDLPAKAVGAAPVDRAEAAWQHGIIRMLATENGTSEERLNRVRIALVTAGATVGEIVPPTPGRNTLPLLEYSFDPASAKSEEVNTVLGKVQDVRGRKGEVNTKVQEQRHPWHQPGRLPEVENLKWPDREGQFNQAQILVDDPSRGQERANKVAEALRKAGANVGEITRDEQGLLTMRVCYHTCAPNIDGIDTVLANVARPSLIGMEVKESQQNKGARKDGVTLVAERQKEDNSIEM